MPVILHFIQHSLRIYPLFTSAPSVWRPHFTAVGARLGQSWSPNDGSCIGCSSQNTDVPDSVWLPSERITELFRNHRRLSRGRRAADRDISRAGSQL